MSKESWKAVVGYEGWYEVSSLGRVRRVKTGPGARVGRILRSGKNHKGYFMVCLCKEGSPHTCKIHRLVLIAFVGLPKPGEESNHKDGVKTHNYPDNLEWLTHKENTLHRCRVLGYRGELAPYAKLANKDIPIIRRLVAEGKLPQRVIGNMFGVSRATIRRIQSGINWAHV